MKKTRHIEIYEAEFWHISEIKALSHSRTLADAMKIVCDRYDRHDRKADTEQETKIIAKGTETGGTNDRS